MKEYDFWKDWEGKTELEESAIKSCKVGKKIILENIPGEQIISIYIRGSFARRELDKKSDIDFMVILKKSNYLKKLNQLNQAYKDKFHPEIEIKGYSLWELKTGKRVKRSVSATPPYRTVKHLPELKLIYGKDLSKNNFFSRSDIKDLKALVNAFRTIFLPQYSEKRMGFRDLIKQTFWLSELEQKVKGENPPHNWKKLDKFIKDEQHIVHDALKYRLQPTKDKNEKAKYLKKLKLYLKELDALT
ncbi:MAG: nucleotidyltransferase domain-containing protein [Nanoarchaeota archaeon]|nr:nucleotidyltransferase domain-containing protein [Nanoarchaeota archaeon]MBU1321713.1 nucleotidyltransferase domain-containing protein [Nanoarchaeota archaeon]MBU1597679.1 nucleotidyltransferase domain-containing protein [Nanoarchaeota archaeon]MBU2441021.1 nucleotidyltransferase domain-containing protein [Nanoarchaeota archaeon]